MPANAVTMPIALGREREAPGGAAGEGEQPARDVAQAGSRTGRGCAGRERGAAPATTCWRGHAGT